MRPIGICECKGDVFVIVRNVTLRKLQWNCSAFEQRRARKGLK